MRLKIHYHPARNAGEFCSIGAFLFFFRFVSSTALHGLFDGPGSPAKRKEKLTAAVVINVSAGRAPSAVNHLISRPRSATTTLQNGTWQFFR